MRFTPSIFGKLLEPIKRRRFDIFQRRRPAALEKPRPVDPSRPLCQNTENQLTLAYA